MSEQLEREWQALTVACEHIVRGGVVKVEDLIAKCRSSDEVRTFAQDAIEVFPRYKWDKTTPYWDVFKSMRESECAQETCNFLMRTRTVFRLISGEPVAKDLFNSFISEVQRSTRGIHELVLIDGLDVYDGPLELEQGCFLRDVAQPWANFVNLYSDQTVRPIQLFSKSDHLLEGPIFEQITLGSPGFHFVTHEDDDGDWEPIVETQVGSQFVQFAKEMDAGRRAATAKEHRAETALRFFARACMDATIQPRHLDEDQLEDVIVNTVICLETILLDRSESKKTRRFSSRGGALLSSSDQKLDDTRKELKRLYDLRSRVVHGGQRQARNELEWGAVYAQECARGALRAFLRLGGDQQALINAVDDSAVRQKQRPLANLP